ncbi:MAG: carboxypeptidase regulatory-like domain-containing protein, partial [Gammaproteobacteria bacterium]
VWTSRNGLRVMTDKTLYKDRDDIVVSIRADRDVNVPLVIDLARAGDLAGDGAVIRSQRVTLRNGRAFTVFRYDPAFRGELAVSAYSLRHLTRYGPEAFFDGRSILYPHSTQLQVKVRATQTVYRPGEDVTASLRVASASGQPIESALGISGVDKAVEERIRSDEEFGSRVHGFWDWSWIEAGGNFGGMTRRDLEKIDRERPVPPDLELVADAILNSGFRGYAPQVTEDDYDAETERQFRQTMTGHLKPFADLLQDRGTPGWLFPVSAAQLESVARDAGIDIAKLADPWGMPYRFDFGVAYRNRTIAVTCAGPDKRFDTDDDMPAGSYSWQYFTPIGRAIDRAVKEVHARSGGYVRTEAMLRQELRREGITDSDLRDPWGNPYEFEFDIDKTNYRIIARSHGPNPKAPDEQPFTAWTSSIDYFAEARGRIDTVLRDATVFPRKEDAWFALLSGHGIQMDQLRDPWNRPYYATFPHTSRFTDATVVRYEQGKEFQRARAVTQEYDWIYIWSNGPDGTAGTSDDFTVASFFQIVGVQSGQDARPRPESSVPLAGGTGAIRGVVTDITGAVIPRARVTATRSGEEEGHAADTDDRGEYLIRNLPAGSYEVKVTAPGFLSFAIRAVPVYSVNVTVVNAELSVGAVSETITVQAAGVVLNTEASSVLAGKRESAGTAKAGAPTFTPRVRDFFPETLYWEPSLITTRSGAAKLSFKLADNITTWKMAVVAS